MRDEHQTLEGSAGGLLAQEAEPLPGLLLLFGAGRPASVCIPANHGAVELGREHPAFVAHPDPRVSRRHVQVRRERDLWMVTDLGSRNGTLVDGEPLASRATTRLTRTLRLGSSLLIPVEDLGPLQRLGVRLAGGRVEGPRSLMVMLAASRAAQMGSTLHITGESGAGKEGVARVFHATGPTAKGPLCAVNCAAIPDGVAERLLFGARRGAYSGADADADGYFQAAHGGTLFLDEIAELPLSVQAKLLRTLETGEVLSLGASRPHKVQVRFCSATHRDLRAQVAAGKFREDLLYRIATPSIRVPPLRERPEEIPWLLEMALEPASPGLPMHVSLVEACLLRPWPGNVRELLSEARDAAQAAALAAAARVEARHLAARAGGAITPGSEPAELAVLAAPPEQSRTTAPPRRPYTRPSREDLERALNEHQWSIRATAKHFTCERKQIWRWIEMYSIAAPDRSERPPGATAEE